MVSLELLAANHQILPATDLGAHLDQRCNLHCMKSEFLCSLWQRKESFKPFMANCKWGFYVFYRKVAILNVSKGRFDHSSVYLGEMKLTPSVFLRRLKYTCSSERFLEI